MKRSVIISLAVLVAATVSLSKENPVSEKTISRYPVPAYDELPADIKPIHDGVKEAFGFVPNVIKALSHRPAELQAFLAYNDAIMNREGGGLTKAEKEMFIVAFSGRNGCNYCVASHGAALRGATGDPSISERVAVNYREAGLSARETAMIDFAMKVSDEAWTIDESDFEPLREHGFSDEDIWDIAAITAFYNMSNRLMSFLAVHPDEEFTMMGRQ